MPEHPNLHLSAEERRLFGQLFTAADTEKIGVVTGEVAVKFFERTRLPPDILGEVGIPHSKRQSEVMLTGEMRLRFGKSRIARIEDFLLRLALE